MAQLSPITEEGRRRQQAIRFLEAFKESAMKLLADRGIPVTGAKIRYWRSTEDSTWERTVLEISLKADPETCLQAWEELGDRLNRAIDALPDDSKEQLRNVVSLSIQW
jgi:hypothetical protein